MDRLPVLTPGQVLPVAVLVVDGGLVTAPLSVLVEEIDDGLSFHLGVDRLTLRQDGFLCHHSSGIKPLLQRGGAYLSPPR
jgi:hypothetical protein